MAFLRQIFRISVLLVAALLVSCIDAREEIWLSADGSGKADVSYTVPAAAAAFQGGEEGINRMLEKLLKSSPAIKSSSHKVTTVGDRLTVRVMVSFDSASDLKKIARDESMEKLPSSATNLAGEVKIGLEGRTLEFSRTIAPGKALPGAIFMPASQFKDRNLTYIIHLPEPVIESNATRTEDSGRTLIWSYALSQAIRKPATMSFKVKVPIPFWMIATAGGTALATAALGFYGVRKIRRKRDMVVALN